MLTDKPTNPARPHLDIEPGDLTPGQMADLTVTLTALRMRQEEYQKTLEEYNRRISQCLADLEEQMKMIAWENYRAQKCREKENDNGTAQDVCRR